MIIPRTVIGAGLVLGVIAGLALFRTVFLRFSAAPGAASVALTGPRVKGAPDAGLKIVEFTDFQCPACARANGVVEELMSKYQGQIFLEHRHFPLAMHAHSRRASVYAECAHEQGRFWPFHDVLFKGQSQWAAMSLVDQYFSDLAVSLGLDSVRLSVCVNGEAAAARVDADVAAGDARGVHSTPTFFVNGKMAVGGKQLTEAVEEALGKK